MVVTHPSLRRHDDVRVASYVIMTSVSAHNGLFGVVRCGMLLRQAAVKMSSERNVEAVGCDASIMKNVWEIRGREYNQKIQHEEERVSKSALPAINKDWASRLEARLGGYKRVERKSKARAEEDGAAPKVKRTAVTRVATPAPHQRTPCRDPSLLRPRERRARRKEQARHRYS
ncbi:hypothetical protein WMY93_020989 [Mugilogobius chulae]|uniref:Uncharacterized protein n=1 Tax=Mugilogobius chulae TaxID=88201 RepID=A0AAW0NDY7_9GOBI